MATKWRRSVKVCAQYADPTSASAGALEKGENVLDQSAGQAWVSSLRLRALYQPVVDLRTGDVVGFEALARGPEGSSMETPGALFAAAAQRHAVSELDWACRIGAMRGALDAGLPTSMQLFLNMEPSAMDAAVPSDALDASAGLSITVEITERGLLADPAGLLRAVAHARGLGWRIAVDDVGADTASLALLPFLRPDVIKLDLRLVQEQADADSAMTVLAVAAESDRTGAVILAEGIETEAHADAAREMGATLGQGWLFGRPGPLRPYPTTDTAPTVPVSAKPTSVTARVPAAVTPFGTAAATRAVRRGSAYVVSAIVEQLRGTALAAAPTTVCLTTMPDMVRTAHGSDAALAQHCALFAAFGVTPVDTSVRHVALHPDDPLAKEWSFVVVNPHFAAAVTAMQDPDGQFAFCLTYDRTTVVAMASLLLFRLHRTSTL
jgi:EAL domain-containing protein (putative c-di-GMP-specific phosphodiesterase class I)